MRAALPSAVADGRLTKRAEFARGWTVLLASAVGGGTLPMTWSRAVTGWFINARGLALGLSLFGTGVVGALLPSYVSALVDAAGWRGAYLGLAILPLVLGLPFALLFFRDPPGDSRPAGANTQEAAIVLSGDYRFLGAVGTRCFWQMCLSFLLGALAVSGVLAHALPLLVDRGVARGTAAALLGLFGLAVTVGRLVSGYFLDVFRGPVVAVVVFSFAAAACCVLAVSGSSLILGGLCIVFVGLAAGAEADIGAYFIAQYFGRREYGAIYGLMFAVYCLGGGFGPPIAGAVFDATGSYQTAFFGGGAALLIAAVLAATLRPPGGLKPAALTLR